MPVTQQHIDSFHRFATERLSDGGADLSIDELFELWRIENPTPEQLHADVLAVKAALRDMEAGDTGQPFEDFKREFRAKNNIGDRA
jgi:hypothetical protein